MVSEHQNARLFFTQFQHLAQSTLTGYRWQISQIYAERCYGYVPWDEESGHPEARYTKKFIDKLVTEARAPQPHNPLEHSLFVRLVQYWTRGFHITPSVGPATTSSSSANVRQASIRGNHQSRNGLGPVSSFAMAAVACFLRGTASRPQDAVRLTLKYVVDRGHDGFDFLFFFYPEIDTATGKQFTRKGHSDAESRHVVMPERLDDGFHLAHVFRNYLTLAHKEGPLFQTVTATGTWSGKGWSSSTITDKLRKALSDNDLNLLWPKDQIQKYSAHSFRSTAATSMACGGVNEAIVSKALNRRG